MQSSQFLLLGGYLTKIDLSKIAIMLRINIKGSNHRFMPLLYNMFFV